MSSRTVLDSPYIEGEAARQRPARSLRLNFSWTLAGNVVYAATQWGILVLLARLGSPEAVGQFSLGLAVAAPVMLFANLSLRAVQATDARLEFQFRDYAGLRILMTLLAACVICGVGAVLYRGGTALAVAAFALSKGIESLSDLVYGLWQQQERMDLIAKSLVLRGVLALAATAVGFAVFQTVWIAVCGMAAAWAGVFVFFDVRRGVTVARQIGQTVVPRFSPARMRQLFRLSLPLGIVAMFISFNANVPRYMISHFRSIRELGIFSALGYILMAGTMIIAALGQSATPRLALFASQGETREFRRLSSRLLLIGAGMGVGGVLAALVCGRRIIAMIYGREYAQDSHLFLWLMIAAATGYAASFAGYSLTAARHFQVQMPLFSAITVLTLALCYVMVKSGGAVGAAQALTIIGIVQLVAILATLWRAEARRQAGPS
ncbi:MAG: oligosaccharide flippase family protein [Candidatus Korobacteraceae bacterium]|jgi:O-antigen/teichoic acid export membrane protein